MFMEQTSRPTSDFLVVIIRLHLNARIDCQYIQFTYFYTLNIKKRLKRETNVNRKMLSFRISSGFRKYQFQHVCLNEKHKFQN